MTDELDDDALDQDYAPGDYDMDEEQRAQMETGLQAIHAILGPGSGIADADIKEALWNFYFDVEQSVEALLG